jgi:two-component system NtrC family sensor kinase
MRRLIQAILRSMEWRLLVPLSITVGIILAIHAMVSFRTTQEHFLSLVHSEADRSSGLIRQATHDGMLLNRFDDVQTMIERLVEQGDVVTIRVCDKKGVIILSAKREEIGTAIPIDSDTCLSCHGDKETKDLALLEQSVITQSAQGPDVLRHLSVIENEPACSVAACHFHPADQRVLGVLDVGLSMAPLQAAIGTSQRQFVSTTILLVVISGLVAAVFVRRLIHRPTRELYLGTQRIAAGDLETPINVPGDHELARLAEAFNRMIRDLRSARREVTMWSETLEQRVARKSDELERAQHQIMHMEKMASLGQLSATVAHELNNPISGMLTYARLVKRELADQSLPDDIRAELERYLDLLAGECMHCGTIVHNMLTFARRNGSEMTHVRLNEVLERSMLLVRHHFEMSNVQLRYDSACEDDEIVADADQIQQALIAMLVNAVEATADPERNDAAVVVRMRDDPDAVTVEIEDNGVGIAEEHIPLLFEPFFSTKGEQRHGVGLGLAVVYGIINRHQGAIEVDSTPAHGTTFRIRLNRRLDDSRRELPGGGATGTVILERPDH